jgi:hypothetical protein
LKKEEELLYLILEKNIYPNLCGIGKIFPNIIATLLQYFLNIHIFAIFWQLWELKHPIVLLKYLLLIFTAELSVKNSENK